MRIGVDGTERFFRVHRRTAGALQNTPLEAVSWNTHRSDLQCCEELKSAPASDRTYRDQARELETDARLRARCTSQKLGVYVRTLARSDQSKHNRSPTESQRPECRKSWS